MGLERDAIIGVALELLDEVGLEGLTTRRLAQALGIKGPSLYWHFKSKREMLDHMAEAMIAQSWPTASPLEPGQPWAEWLADRAYSLRRAALSRRDGALLMMGQKPTGESPTFPAMVRRLEGAGFTAAEAQHALMSAGRYSLGWAAAEQAAMERPTGIDYEAAFAFGLRALVDGLALHLARNG